MYTKTAISHRLLLACLLYIPNEQLTKQCQICFSNVLCTTSLQEIFLTHSVYYQQTKHKPHVFLSYYRQYINTFRTIYFNRQIIISCIISFLKDKNYLTFLI